MRFTGLSRNPLLNLCSLYELQTKPGSFFREYLDLLVAVFLFIELGAFVDVLLAEPEQPVDDSRQLVGHGFDGLGSAQARP